MNNSVQKCTFFTFMNYLQHYTNEGAIPNNLLNATEK